MNFKRLIFSVFVFAFLCGSVRAGTWTTGSVKNAAGSLEYKLWIPDGYVTSKNAALVLMLHGCMQKPEDLAAISGMNVLADTNNFLVAYPQQTAAANPLNCWNWFDPKHQERDVGEPSLIAAVVQQVETSYSVDAARVYVVGISAGGAMAVLLAATYPELFNGVAVVAGTEYKAATTVQGGLAAMKQGGPDPKQQGQLAFEAIQRTPGATKKKLPLIAFQGAKDPYVNPINTEQLIAQWAKTNDYLDDGKSNESVSLQSVKESKGSVAGGYGYTKYSYYDHAKHLLMEKWLVDDLGHAWPGSPITNRFADPKGPNATAELWRFFNDTRSAPKQKGKNK